MLIGSGIGGVEFFENNCNKFTGAGAGAKGLKKVSSGMCACTTGRRYSSIANDLCEPILFVSFRSKHMYLTSLGTRTVAAPKGEQVVCRRPQQAGGVVEKQPEPCFSHSFIPSKHAYLMSRGHS